MKKVNVLLLSALIATITTGCGGNGETSSSISSQEEHHEPVTITYASWDLGPADAEAPNIERMMIDEFEKEYQLFSRDTPQSQSAMAMEMETN